jgi:hypothetical protein
MFEGNKTPLEFVNAVFIVKFYRIAMEAAEPARDGKTKAWYEKRLTALLEKFRAKYLNADGSCKLPGQTALPKIVAWQLYTNLAPMIEQLKKAMRYGRSSGSSSSTPPPSMRLWRRCTGVCIYWTTTGIHRSNSLRSKAG